MVRHQQNNGKVGETTTPAVENAALNEIGTEDDQLTNGVSTTTSANVLSQPATVSQVSAASSTGATTTTGVPGALPQRTHNQLSSDNMRDIGTWSNEQAEANKSRRAFAAAAAARAGAGGQGGQFNNTNRYANSVKSSSGAAANNNSTNNTAAAEEWENEEEWQGDLTKTQIFTSSSVQKTTTTNVSGQKEVTITAATTVVPGGVAPTPSAFPIGHFNAEEAAQNIKKAVGVS